MEKEKLLIVAPFPTVFSTLLENFLLFWRTFHHFNQISNCHLRILSVWKTLNFVNWERLMARFPIGGLESIEGKRRNTVFSTFPTVFSKTSVP